MNNESSDIEVKKPSIVWSILRWFLAVMFLIFDLGIFAAGSVIGGIIFLIISLLFIPQVTRYLSRSRIFKRFRQVNSRVGEKTSNPVTQKKVRIIIGLVVLAIPVIVIIAAVANSPSDTPTSPVASTIATTPSTADTTQSVCSSSTLKTDAKKISYKELSKDPTSFMGQVARFTGKVLQIQESDGQGFLRLAVSEDSYGYWDPNSAIFIAYQGTNDAVEGDIVTVYGQLSGPYTYTSQANYQITIPSMIGCLVQKGSAASTPTTSTSKTPTKQPTSPAVSQAPKSWHTVTTFTGNGIKQTAPFSIQGGEWRMNWQTTGQFNFILNADSTDGSSESCSGANIIGNGSDTSYCYQSGQFYLEVNTGNQWTITVEDYY